LNRFETLYFFEQLRSLLLDGLCLDGDPLLFIIVPEVSGQVHFAKGSLTDLLVQLVLVSQHGRIYLVLTVFLLHLW